MNNNDHGQSGTLVQITLNAVLAALKEGEPYVLCTHRDDIALPYGPFDPTQHRTFEIGLRDWVTRQTKVTLGYVEQLYTFGDRGRENGDHTNTDIANDQIRSLDHIVSVGYLALAPEPASVEVSNASWRSWYAFFPWEDWRNGEPECLTKNILPNLHQWCESASSSKEQIARHQRFKIAFAIGGTHWEEERTLERFELMYEAGLVPESPDNCSSQDLIPTNKTPPSTGRSMAADHRRILATAIGRLRGKLKYRPVIFEMMGTEFTLLNLQKSVEAIIGFQTHKQNFRRSVESMGLVERTGNICQVKTGRPAALFKINREALKDRAASRLVIPRLKQSSSFKP